MIPLRRAKTLKPRIVFHIVAVILLAIAVVVA
jgi:hypothetical protein